MLRLTQHSVVACYNIFIVHGNCVEIGECLARLLQDCSHVAHEAVYTAGHSVVPISCCWGAIVSLCCTHFLLLGSNSLTLLYPFPVAGER